MHEHDKQSRHMFGVRCAAHASWTQHGRGGRLCIVQHSFDKLRRLIKKKSEKLIWLKMVIVVFCFIFLPNNLLEDHYVCLVKLIRIFHWRRSSFASFFFFLVLLLNFCLKFAICLVDRDHSVRDRISSEVSMSQRGRPCISETTKDRER